LGGSQGQNTSGGLAAADDGSVVYNVTSGDETGPIAQLTGRRGARTARSGPSHVRGPMAARAPGDNQPRKAHHAGVDHSDEGGVLHATRRTPLAAAVASLVLVMVAAAVLVLVRAFGGGGGDDPAGGAGGDSAGPRRVLRGTPRDDSLVLADLGPEAARAELYGGRGDDFVTAFPAEYDGVPIPVAVLSGGEGDDAITGYARALDGGPGDDLIRTYELREPVVSSVRCGRGEDTLTMDRQLDGPLDRFGPDCEFVRVWIWSTVRGNQVLRGTPYDDRIRTLSDAIGGGDDVIRSRGGDDRVQGDWGSDLAYLGAGDDLYSDVTTHARGDLDRIHCGAGNDEVWASRVDQVASDCEIIRYWD
jgi:Ca2+-binding RTX toxin-like protein